MASRPSLSQFGQSPSQPTAGKSRSKAGRAGSSRPKLSLFGSGGDLADTNTEAAVEEALGGASSARSLGTFGQAIDTSEATNPGQLGDDAKDPTGVRQMILEGVNHVLGSKAIQGAVDILSRGEFAMTGIFDEMSQARNGFEGAINAGERVFRELSSGGTTPTESAKKLTYTQLFAQMGMPEGPQVSVVAPWLFKDDDAGWYDLRPSVHGILDTSTRSALGLGASILGDPTTYLTGGTGKAVGLALKGGKAAGTLRGVSRAGRKAIKTAKAEELPEAMRYAARLQGITNPTTANILELSADNIELYSKIESVGHDIAEAAAHTRVFAAVKAGEKGLVVNSGLRFMGRTVVPGAAFEAGGDLSQKLLRQVAEMPIGKQIMGGVRSVDKGVQQMFAATLRAAGHTPGYQAAQTAFRTEQRVASAALKRTMAKLTAGWDQAKLVGPPVEAFGRTIDNVYEYVGLHLNDPTTYKADRLPEVVRDKLSQIRRITDEQFDVELHLGYSEPGAYRPNYWAQYYKNNSDQMAQFSDEFREIGVDQRSNMSLGASGESRQFATFTEAAEVHARMRANGKVDFDLDPILDFRETFIRRGTAHNTAIAADNFMTRVKTELGVPIKEVEREIFRKTFPELDAIAMDAFETGIGSSQVAKILKQDGVRDVVGKLLRKADAGEKVVISGFDPEIKALYFMGRIRNARDLPELEKLMNSVSTRDWAEIDMDFVNRMRTVLQSGKEKAVATWNEPYGTVKLVKTSRGGLLGKAQSKDSLAKKRAAVEGLDPTLPSTGPISSPRVTVAAQKRVGARGALRAAERQTETFWLPKGVAEQVARLDDKVLADNRIVGMLKRFDLMNDWFKTGVYTIWPASHFRNSYSNVAQAFVELGVMAVDPLRAKRAWSVISGGEGTFRVGDRQWTNSQLLDDMINLGVVNESDVTIELLTNGARRRAVIDSKPVQLGRAAATKLENHAKAGVYLASLERGMSSIAASQRAHKVFFDYDDISSFHRQILKRLFPFPTWTIKNFGRVVKTLPRDVGRYSVFAKIRDRDRGPESDSLPDWEQGRFRWRLDRPRGKTTYVTGLDLPFDAAVERALPTSFIKAIAQDVGPVLNIIQTIGTGVEPFSGRSADERVRLTRWAKAMTLLPKETQNWLGWREDVGREGQPEYSINATKATLLLKSYAFSRMFYTLQRTFREGSNFQNGLINILTGVSFDDADVPERTKRAVRNNEARLTRHLKRKGALRTFEIPFVPKTQQEAGGTLKTKKKKGRRPTITFGE